MTTLFILAGCGGTTAAAPVAPVSSIDVGVASAKPAPAAPRMKNGVYRRMDDSNNCDYEIAFLYDGDQLVQFKSATTPRYGRKSYELLGKTHACGEFRETVSCDGTSCKQAGEMPITFELFPPNAYESISANGQKRARYEFLGD